ncbi:MAG: alpha/beta fold hydrolase [Verrucomicrobiota bacterium]|nr:alpha/beta fold hydrolase [Verrucomicrobiota bacterium]
MEARNSKTIEKGIKVAAIAGLLNVSEVMNISLPLTTMSRFAAEQLLTRAFDSLNVTKTRPEQPAIEESSAFICGTWDENRPVAGWSSRSITAKATVFFCHGFMGHSMDEWILREAEAAMRLGCSVISLDFRYHGRSHRRVPTFGTAEMWDIQAALQWAERQNFPKPFILVGFSLGAMAAGRTAICDERVAAAFLISPPAWPWDAIGTGFADQGWRKLVWLGQLINVAYDGWDVLGDGDLRRHNAYPIHRPRICYAMGDRDQYGSGKTRMVFNHWYGADSGGKVSGPSQQPEAQKWWIDLDCDHNSAPDHSSGILSDFLRTVLP